jgi:hypothetical protein
MKPMSASDALKTSGFVHRNRYEVLRTGAEKNSSRTDIPRERSDSVKRKASGEINVANQKKVNIEPVPVLSPQDLVSMEQKLRVMKGLSTTMTNEASKLKLDPGLETIIKCMCEFVDVSVSYHEELTKNCSVEVNSRSDTSGHQEAAPQDPDGEVFETYSRVTKKPAKVPVPVVRKQPQQAKDPKLQAFQDAVKHAERSTLIFNLDLGSKKTLNEKTILTNATLALSAAAAKVEGKGASSPSKDTVAALDDVMSVTQNVVLYGKVTRPYENKSNPADPKKQIFLHHAGTVRVYG